ncbi:MAG: hypothetical protein HC915_18465 [Anaerolineae bacterium]|nr:hypothetical protein [Anaerolineae bacterium]
MRRRRKQIDFIEGEIIEEGAAPPAEVQRRRVRRRRERSAPPEETAPERVAPDVPTPSELALTEYTRREAPPVEERPKRRLRLPRWLPGARCARACSCWRWGW